MRPRPGRRCSRTRPAAGAGQHEPLVGATQIDGLYWKTRDTVLPRILNPSALSPYAGSWPPADAFSRTDFRLHVWLQERELSDIGCAKTGGTAQVGDVTYRANAVEIGYRAGRPAWLVLNEITAPGWWAEVDGREVLLLRAACVPAGTHRLSFGFSPLRMLKDSWAQ